MRIGIDARFYGPAGKGLGRYTERLVQHLEDIDHINEYVIFLRRENWDVYQPKSPNFKKVLADFVWYGLAEQIKMPGLVEREGIDLMHYTHFNVPLISSSPFVVTIHDLILLQYPTERATTLGPLLYKIKEIGYKWVIWSAVCRASKVITVSQYTKRQIVKYFKVSDDKVEVTYEAGEGSGEMGRLKIPEMGSFSPRIIRPYFLYVGNAYPHKNMEGLLKSFRWFLDYYGTDYQLVLVGKMDYFYKRLKRQALKLGLLEKKHPHVVFWGYAAQEELADLYRNACVYVFPSFFEGFGLPALEAMHYNIPVCASRSSCLPEILGEAAHYFDPKDFKDMARQYREVATNLVLRRKLIKNGMFRVKKYDWSQCAKKTLAVYGRVAL